SILPRGLAWKKLLLLYETVLAKMVFREGTTMSFQDAAAKRSTTCGARKDTDHDWTGVRDDHQMVAPGRERDREEVKTMGTTTCHEDTSPRLSITYIAGASPVTSA